MEKEEGTMTAMKFKGIDYLVNVAAFFITLIVITSLLPAQVFSEEYKMWTYTKLPATPEGVCVDSKNKLYASMMFTVQRNPQKYKKY